MRKAVSKVTTLTFLLGLFAIPPAQSNLEDQYNQGNRNESIRKNICQALMNRYPRYAIHDDHVVNSFVDGFSINLVTHSSGTKFAVPTDYSSGVPHIEDSWNCNFRGDWYSNSMPGEKLRLRKEPLVTATGYKIGEVYSNTYEKCDKQRYTKKLINCRNITEELQYILKGDSILRYWKKDGPIVKAEFKRVNVKVEPSRPLQGRPWWQSYPKAP